MFSRPSGAQMTIAPLFLEPFAKNPSRFDRLLSFRTTNSSHYEFQLIFFACEKLSSFENFFCHPLLCFGIESSFLPFTYTSNPNTCIDGCMDPHPTLGQNFFIFMQFFLKKIGQIVNISAPPGKSWIHHWHVLEMENTWLYCVW